MKYKTLKALSSFWRYVLHHHTEIAMIVISGSWIIFLLSKLFLWNLLFQVGYTAHSVVSPTIKEMLFALTVALHQNYSLKNTLNEGVDTLLVDTL